MNNKNILIINYGMGNLKSVWNALAHLGSTPVISAHGEDFRDADAFILPGVGSYAEAMENLGQNDTIDLLSVEVIEKQKPILGICLGMQLLAQSSEEGGGCKGLGWIPGDVKKMRSDNGRKIPHIGWNDIEVTRQTPLFEGFGNLESFYFLHSYTLDCDERYVVARSNYGGIIPAVVQKGNIIGTQFHPERSSQKGLRLLQNFLDII